ncbi:NAD(P)-dependent oxidoreductase [Kaistia dalseonensis]|uniref:dihydrouracil dehydrogenase (NAD(+)) n=1 Tax=Kaistia dalseonensis TaxID=410840 RepID=A0ABU0HDI2_9HYPH|nr:NAD(P)-dependent oxidoreductase [Kaistia dalseonensis]MCX5497731.1 NAD(P)-dependent oxidoreductase [Kaistia dalseonensis]MDQ0440375.1 glutamate synthase (NADPH/NADH) small chain [Kaistia dalseonensis]
MPSSAPDIAAGRLSPAEYAANFNDIHPPLDQHQALVEADRCYFCYDAPCVKACPTSIDIPLFIRQILTHNPIGSAETIFEQNILGGMCARVCPTETLCEEACVREEAEGKPVKIGLLQRYATDTLMEEEGEQPFERAPSTGKRVAVIGGGPAGLSAAHRLARHGHDVVIYDAREKAGGLNEYGIAAYKAPDNFAQAEVDFVLSIGGITVEHGKALGRDITLGELKQSYDAVFLGMGLAGVNALGLAEEALPGVADAVDYIAELRQAKDLGSLPVAGKIVVVGGGMTAIDVAVQSKRLGADEVTIVYRRGQDKMGASLYEQELAATSGVVIRHHAKPAALKVEDGRVIGMTFEKTADQDGRLVGTGETFDLSADMVFKAIGQTFVPGALNGAADAIALDRGKIKVDEERRTSISGVWAGGDCAATGEDLTVAAVADGRIAAESIHRALTAA